MLGSGGKGNGHGGMPAGISGPPPLPPPSGAPPGGILDGSIGKGGMKGMLSAPNAPGGGGGGGSPLAPRCSISARRAGGKAGGAPVAAGGGSAALVALAPLALLTVLPSVLPGVSARGEKGSIEEPVVIKRGSGWRLAQASTALSGSAGLSGMSPGLRYMTSSVARSRSSCSYLAWLCSPRGGASGSCRGSGAYQSICSSISVWARRKAPPSSMSIAPAPMDEWPPVSSSS